MKKNVIYIVIAVASLLAGVLGTYAVLDPARHPGAAQVGDTHDRAGESTDAHSGHEHTQPDAGDWCAEHRVPESQCTKCHPEKIVEFREAGDWCGEHDSPESHCRLCNPGLRFENEPVLVAAKVEGPSVYFARNATACNTDGAIIQFASVETAARTGIVVEPVLHLPGDREIIEAPAEIIFDETQSQLITTSVPATVVRWLAEPGASLTAGAAIAELESPEMASLQADYLEALAESRFDAIETQRADSLYANRLISEVEYQQKRSEYQIVAARLTGWEGRLRAAGMSRRQIDELEETGVGSRWTLRAERPATLLERQAPLGVQQTAGGAIALIGDPRALWIHGHVRERDAQAVRVGQQIEFALDGSALDRVRAEVFWVAQFVDPVTRTVAVRARLMDTSGGLKAHRFGRMLVAHDDEQHGILVDKNAIQWEGCCNIAFVQAGPNQFIPRKVTIERGDRTHYRVTSGLEPGELVVVNGSYLLKTELMKSSLGAGCAGH